MRAIVVSLAVSTLLHAHALAQTPDQNPTVDRIASDIFSVCETPSGSLEDSAAAIRKLDAGYKRIGDGDYASLVNGDKTGQSFAPGTRQAWRATYGISSVIVEIRSGMGGNPVNAEFMSIQADRAKLRDLIRAHLGEPVNSQSPPGKNATDAFNPKPGQGAPVFFQYDPARPDISKLTCSQPATPGRDYAAITQAAAARELAEEMWTICGLQAPRIDWFGQVLGLLPSRYQRLPDKLEKEYFADPEVAKARAGFGLTVSNQQLWGHKLTSDVVLTLELYEQVEKGVHRFEAEFNFDQKFVPDMRAAIIERFGPREPLTVTGKPTFPVERYGKQSPQEPGSRSIMLITKDKNNNLVSCSPRKAS